MEFKQIAALRLQQRVNKLSFNRTNLVLSDMARLLPLVI